MESLRSDEMTKLDSRLAALEPSQRDMVETLSRQLLAKMLHEPTVRLKEHAGTVQGQRMADALRTLFDLDER